MGFALSIADQFALAVKPAHLPRWAQDAEFAERAGLPVLDGFFQRVEIIMAWVWLSLTAHFSVF